MLNNVKTMMLRTMPLFSSSRWRQRVVPAGGSGAQQVVDPLQLSVWQHQAVNLLVAVGARHHDPAHQHRVALPLLFGLQDTEQQQHRRVRQVTAGRFVSGVRARVTFTNSVEGKVAKSEETLAPGCWWTTCSATSSCTTVSQSHC